LEFLAPKGFFGGLDADGDAAAALVLALRLAGDPTGLAADLAGLRVLRASTVRDLRVAFAGAALAFFAAEAEDVDAAADFAEAVLVDAAGALAGAALAPAVFALADLGVGAFFRLVVEGGGGALLF